MTLGRVLLVDDDPLARRLVAAVLAALPIELVPCDSVAQARQLLASGPPFRLILTDLTLPGESGLVLLQCLRDQPGLRGDARLVVYSAGEEDVVRAALDGLSVDDILPKPAAMSRLLGCVRRALAVAADGGAPPDTAGEPPAGEQRHDGHAFAVQQHFAGSEALFREFEAVCIERARLDIAAGDGCVARCDWPALRRLGHNLKSALRMIGREEDSDTAALLEAATDDAAGAAWAPLRAGLRRLAAAGGDAPPNTASADPRG